MFVVRRPGCVVKPQRSVMFGRSASHAAGARRLLQPGLHHAPLGLNDTAGGPAINIAPLRGWLWLRANLAGLDLPTHQSASGFKLVSVTVSPPGVKRTATRVLVTPGR
jgi:hypothetical protein